MYLRGRGWWHREWTGLLEKVLNSHFYNTKQELYMRYIIWEPTTGKVFETIGSATCGKIHNDG